MRWFIAMLELGLGLGLVGCGGLEREEAAAGPGLETLRQAELEETMGYRDRQGRHLFGFANEADESAIRGFRLSSVALPNNTVESAWLYQGTLQVRAFLPMTGWVPSLDACAGTEPGGVTRNCGWSSKGVGQCTPGTPVRLASPAACTTSACTGNPMMRVCTGRTPCDYSATPVSAAATTGMLATDDDTFGKTCFYGSQCPDLTFTCPNSGTYNVLLASSVTGASASMTVVASTGSFPAKGTLTGKELQGATVRAQTWSGTLRSFRISGVEAQPQEHWPTMPAGGVMGMTYRYLLQELTHGMPYLCNADTSSKPLPAAIPVKGYWDTTGRHLTDDADLFTFSCSRGVVAKCYCYGYRPWAPGSPDDHLTPTQMHQACTRMARADYCGKGESLTAENTMIDYYDMLATQVSVYDAHPEMFFEAAWTPDGARCVSKKRYDNMGGLMPFACSQLVDDTPERAVRICNDVHEAMAMDPALELFNDSQINFVDAGTP